MDRNIPVQQIPQEKHSVTIDGKRPWPVERHQMVRALVHEMKRYEANRIRSEYLTIIRNLISKIFADMTADGSLLGGGYTPPLYEVKNPIQNVNHD